MNQYVGGIEKRAAAILSAPHMRAHTQVRPCGKRQSLPRYFGGVAPTAARRARPVQRGGFQGLRGNPDACRPRRGSACHETAGKTGVDARPVSALSVQRAAAMSPRFGGLGVEPPPLLFPHFFGKKWGRRRRPKLRIVRFRAGPKAHSLRWASSPHDDHSVGSPRGPHWARPARGQPLWAGDHRSLLRTARRVVAPHGASGCGGKRADDIRPYRVGQLPARRAGPPREGAPRCGNGGNPSSGPAGRLPPGGGVTCGGGKPPPYWLAMRSARSLRYTQRSIFCSRAASSSACLACNSWRAT